MDSLNDKLRANSGYFQSVLDSIDDYAIFTTDKKGNITTWNAGASNVLGYSEDEIIGQNTAIFFTKADLKKSADKVEQNTALTKGSAIDERYHVHKDGSEFWSIGKAFPLYDNQNNHIGFTKVMRNINSTRLAEEQLQQATKYSNSIIETASQPIVVFNEDLTISSANDAFYKLFKLNKKRFLKRPIYYAAHGLFNSAELAQLLELVGKSGKTLDNHEFEYEWPSLGKKFFLINARKLKQPQNNSPLIMFSIEDITERRSLEQQKDDFISIASHEIKTPITVIKAYAQLLKKRSESVKDDFLATTAEKVNTKSEKLMSLVNYLLDTTQLASGEWIIRKSLFNLSDLLVESIDELKLIDKHHFKFKGNIAEEINADRFRISQAINNLLNNACKYSPESSTIVVNLTKNKKGDQITMSVKDEGYGIPKDEQRNLFKRFWRASTARESNMGGIGLGLHITHEIVRQHKGKVWLKSDLNKGSTFYITLPVNADLT